MSRPRVRLLSGAAVLALTLASGCAGSSGEESTGDNGPKKHDKQAEQSAPRPSDDALSDDDAGELVPVKGPTLSGTELEKAAVVTSDVQQYAVMTLSEADKGGMGEGEAKSPACQPIAALVSGVPDPEPSAILHRQVVSTTDHPSDPAPSVLEILAAYEKADAAAYLPALRKAVDSCDGGFGTTGGDSATYTGIETLKAPAAADDAFSFRLDRDMQGTELPMAVHVVRHGTTVAAFLATSLTPDVVSKVPASLIEAQVAKLR